MLNTDDWGWSGPFVVGRRAETQPYHTHAALLSGYTIEECRVCPCGRYLSIHHHRSLAQADIRWGWSDPGEGRSADRDRLTILRCCFRAPCTTGFTSIRWLDGLPWLPLAVCSCHSTMGERGTLPDTASPGRSSEIPATTDTPRGAVRLRGWSVESGRDSGLETPGHRPATNQRRAGPQRAALRERPDSPVVTPIRALSVAGFGL